MADADVKRQLTATDHMACGLEIKGIEPIDGGDGGWKVGGYFAVFGNLDHDGDVIERGAFKRTLAERLPKIKDHHGVTVGQATKAHEDEHGLFVEGVIRPTTAGRDLVTLMEPVETDRGPIAPVEQGSIGYVPAPGGAKMQAGARHLSDLDLFEVSPVTFGANPATRIGLVKSFTPAEIDGPLDDTMVEAGRTLTGVVSEVKALHARRMGAGKSLQPRYLETIGALAIESGDAMVSLLAEEQKAGRSLSATRRRHIASVVRALRDLLDSLPEAEREDIAEQLAADVDNGGKAADDDTEQKAETPAVDEAEAEPEGDAPAEPADEPAESKSQDLQRARDIRLDLLRRRLAQHAPTEVS